MVYIWKWAIFIKVEFKKRLIFMIINIGKLPYRKNVAGIVIKNDLYLLLQRIDWPDNYWKFPQGGVGENETEKDALKRELIEEIGTDKFKIIGKSVNTNQYDWNDYSIKKADFKWRGQSQTFFFVEFLGNDIDINIDKNDIKKYMWVKKEELKKYIDHNDKNFANYFLTIEKILKEFGLYNL